jgi:tetratricopeptide (TPR) repeat protein
MPTTDTSSSAEITPTAEMPSISEFVRPFLDLVDSRATGTLRVVYEDDTKIEVFFREGGIGDVDPSHSESLLFHALLATGQVTEKDIKKARKRADKEGEPTIGLCLFDLQKVEQDELLERVEQLVTEAVCGVFSLNAEHFEFFEHDKSERLHEFNTEVSEVFELFFDGRELFIEAMRRLDRWDMIEENLTCLWDVFYATPRGMQYYSDPDTYATEIAILGQIDGIRDLEEVLEVSDIPQFECLQYLKALERQGDIEIVNPVQLFQMGVDCTERRQFEKAWKVFQRAIQRGLDDFDVQFKLAETCAAIERDEEAIRHYEEFAEKCLDQARRREAVVALRRICELDPMNLEVQSKLMDLLVQIERLDEAVVQGLTTAKSLVGANRHADALGLLVTLRDRGVKEAQLSRKIIELAETCGEQKILEQELSADPSQVDDLIEPDRALETYERLFCEGNDSVEIRIKLVELHQQLGNRDKVLGHLNGLLGSSRESEIRDAKVLANLHKTRCQLMPGHIPSSRWLIDFQLKNGKVQEALATLHNLIEQLENKEHHYLLVDARKRLVILDKENYEPRWKLARLYERIGHQEKAISEIEQIAKTAARREDRKTTREAWTAILEIAPYHVEAISHVGNCLESSGDTKGALERFKAVARVDIINGNIDGVLRCIEHLERLEDEDVKFQYDLAQTLLASGKKEKGLEVIKVVTQKFIASRDLGMARQALELAFCEAPGQDDVLQLKDELETLERKLEAPEVVPAPAKPDATAVSPHPTLQGTVTSSGTTVIKSEPFQGRSPVTSRGKVSAITARLKNLQSGETPTRPAGRQIVIGGINKISSSLKNLQGKGAAEDERDDEDEEGSGSEDKTQLISGEDSQDVRRRIARETAASRMNAEETPKESRDSLERAVQKSKAGVKLKMNNQASALAKLRAMKQGGDQDSEAGPQSAPVEPTTENVPVSDSPASPSKSNDSLAMAVEKANAGVKVQMNNQSSALAKLRALKQGVGEAQAEPESVANESREAGAVPKPTVPQPKSPQPGGGSNDALERAVQSVNAGVKVQMKNQTSALDRLRALKQGGDSDQPAEDSVSEEFSSGSGDAAPHPTVPSLDPPSGGASTDSSKDALERAVQSANTGVKVQMSNQASALEKLRALKQGRDAEQPDDPGEDTREQSEMETEQVL